MVKVSKSRKKNIFVLDSPKKPTLGHFPVHKCPSICFFGESRTTIFFRDLLTFRNHKLFVRLQSVGTQSLLPCVKKRLMVLRCGKSLTALKTTFGLVVFIFEKCPSSQIQSCPSEFKFVLILRFE